MIMLHVSAARTEAHRVIHIAQYIKICDIWKFERDKKCAEIKVKVKAENDVRGMKIDFVERYNRKTKRKRY